jgi:ribosomal protein S18 acetylase RimI-like enzyme
MVPHARVDEATLRFLERHETLAHALPVRAVRDLGDALLLTDPLDPDPFWNRAVSLRWPRGSSAFDRRLAELLALFAILDRRPHIWPSPGHNQPGDLVARLESHGFTDIGGGHLMVLADPARAPHPTHEEVEPGTELELIHETEDPTAAAEDAAHVLVEAFAADPGRRDGLADDLALSMSDPRVAVVIARVGGVAAAVAKATSFDGATYLSSIGTRPSYRGRGLGSLVTRAAVAHGHAMGSRWQYLGVFSGNAPALSLYGRLGFATLGDAPDLLLE